jgi:hypothetical protein
VEAEAEVEEEEDLIKNLTHKKKGKIKSLLAKMASHASF